jgi:tetratricopeptide (TPR) repeat protein
MNPEAFGRLREVLLTALALSDDERSAYLDRACGDDEELRREVESLLAHDGRDASLLAPGGLGVPSPRARIPESIGPYRVLEILGEGGMGVVYRAVQDDPVRREVALKVARDESDSPDAVARFELERRTLAPMDHPNIARLFDAGATESGRPFFAMELVRGVPITEYCRSTSLTIEERLRLFLDVCRAVRYAHRRGVIHRDLKPSNVLITSVGGQAVPKVIDFGIAKTLGQPPARDFRTRTGQVVGTLESMSPEQAEGRVDAVDTRSDVYALGVLLYELIADRPPHDLAGLPVHEAVRKIVHEPPRTLAAAEGRRVDPDLRTIVEHCLAKDPDRRYGSAADLAEDLERTLDSRPILARPWSAVYRLRKLAGRHRVAVGVASLVLVFLLILFGTVTVQLGIQRRERARAESQARRAERVTEFLQEAFTAARESVGYDATVKQALDVAAARLAERKSEPSEADVAILQVLAGAYGNFQQLEKADRLLREALRLQEQRLGPNAAEVGSAHQLIGANLYYMGKMDEAEQETRLALTIHEAQHPADPATLASDLSALAMVRLRKGHFAEAESLLRREAAQYAAMPGTKDTALALAISRENLANALQAQGRFADAESLMREVLETRRANGGDIGWGDFNLAFLLERQGKHGEAEALYRKTIEETSRVQGPGSGLVVQSLLALAGSLYEQGRLSEAERAQRQAAGALRELGALAAPELANALRGLARSLTAQGRIEEAERAGLEALGIDRKGQGEEGLAIANDWSVLGNTYMAGGQWAKAEAAYRKTLALREKVPSAELPIAEALALLARMLEAQGRFEEAASLNERSLAIMSKRYSSDAIELLTARGLQAAILDDLGRFDDAAPIHADVLARMRATLGKESQWIAGELARQAAALHKQGRLDEALPVAVEAVSLNRSLPGDMGTDLAVSLGQLADIQQGLGNLDEARSAARESLVIWSKAAYAPPDRLCRARTIAGGP